MQMQLTGELSHLLTKVCQVERQNQQIINMVVEANKGKESKDLDSKDKKKSLQTACSTETEEANRSRCFEYKDTETQVEVH